jgi:hypothetical protein
MSKNNDMKMLEEKIQALVKESVQEALNTANRDVNGEKDGRYFYQGTGSPESKERMEKLRKGLPGYNNYTDKPDSFTSPTGHKESPYYKQSKEYGGFETLGTLEGACSPKSIICHLRDLASKNAYDKGESPEDFQDNMRSLKLNLEALMTRQGAKDFIEFLYKNGFKQEWIGAVPHEDAYERKQKKQQSKQTNESTLKLSQDDLNRMIRESVEKILNK